MGKVDAYRRLLKKNKQLGGYLFDEDVIKRFIKKHEDTESALSDAFSALQSSDFTNITDRSQIINPTSWLEEFGIDTSYDDGQSLYDRYFSMLLDIQKQQEASYEEYYNSPEQQVIRDKIAGLNPDILGVSGSQASSPDLSSVNPMDAMREREALRLQEDTNRTARLSSVVQSLVSVASLGSAFSSIALNKSSIALSDSSKVSGELSNLTLLKGLLSGDIDDLLASAMNDHLNSGSDSEFDIDSWFSNDDNFSHLSDIYGSFSSFKPALYQARKSVLAHRKNAVKQQLDNADYQSDFMQIYSNPRYSFEQKLHYAQLRPYISRLNRLEDAKTTLDEVITQYTTSYNLALNPETAAASLNSRNAYDYDYYSELDGKLVAAFESFMREVQISAGTMSKEINNNYYQMYSADPNSVDGWRAAYLFGSNGGTSWQDAYLCNSLDYFNNLMQNNQIIQTAIANNAELREKIASFGALLGNLPSSDDVNQLNRLGWKQYRNDLLNFINSLEKVADSLD